MYRSFREIIELLDSQGKLVRLTKPVNPRFEMPALMKTLEDEAKAFIFENVQGSDYKAVGGLFTSMGRFGLIFNEDGNEDGTYGPGTHTYTADMNLITHYESVDPLAEENPALVSLTKD